MSVSIRVFLLKKMVAYQKSRKSSEKLHPLKNGFQLKLQFFFCKNIFSPPSRIPIFFEPAEKCTEIFRFGGHFVFPESKIIGKPKNLDFDSDRYHLESWETCHWTRYYKNFSMAFSTLLLKTTNQSVLKVQMTI